MSWDAAYIYAHAVVTGRRDVSYVLSTKRTAPALRAAILFGEPGCQIPASIHGVIEPVDIVVERGAAGKHEENHPNHPQGVSLDFSDAQPQRHDSGRECAATEAREDCAANKRATGVQ